MSSVLSSDSARATAYSPRNDGSNLIAQLPHGFTALHEGVVPFAPNQNARAEGWQFALMRKLIVFKCPATGEQVQTPLPVEPRADGMQAFEAVKRVACARLHFVGRTTGKVLGREAA